MPKYLVKVGKGKKVDFVVVPPRMTAAQKAQFEKNRKTIFKNHLPITAPNKDDAITQALRAKKRIGPDEFTKFKKVC
jgi:hypothetical protein